MCAPRSTEGKGEAREEGCAKVKLTQLEVSDTESVRKFLKCLEKYEEGSFLGGVEEWEGWEPPKKVVGCGLTQPTDKDDNCSTIASDCAGMCSEGDALEFLGV